MQDENEALRAVHPHRRGEHRVFHHFSECDGGSSPQAWGTLFPLPWGGTSFRFIPTGVGNTKKVGSSLRFNPVHPHRRGEHFPSYGRLSLEGGSSPQAWGTRGETIADRGGHRFIPTGVGNTTWRIGALLPRPVHPHRRGEHSC